MRLDTVDVRILELLQDDGRSSLRDVSKSTGVTTPTVSSKVQTMTDLRVIRGYHADIDSEILNELTVLLTLECRPSDVSALTDVLKGRDEVRELYVMDGTQVFAKATVLGMTHLQQFLGVLATIKEITIYRYHTITGTVKELPRAVLHKDLLVTVDCYYCRKPIHDAPVKLHFDGKDHYLCCGSCAKLYKEKYDRLKDGAAGA